VTFNLDIWPSKLNFSKFEFCRQKLMEATGFVLPEDPPLNFTCNVTYSWWQFCDQYVGSEFLPRKFGLRAEFFRAERDRLLRNAGWLSLPSQFSHNAVWNCATGFCVAQFWGFVGIFPFEDFWAFLDHLTAHSCLALGLA